ncbi:MAG: sulfatase-like hydrolase/transferase [Myxococcota bacterium]
MSVDDQTALLALLGAGAAAGLGRALRASRRRPARLACAPELNVLLVVTDQERSWDQLPAGFIDRHCPSRASLRERGVVFGGAHTPIQLCSMARGAMYTGVHPQNNGLWENVPVPMARDLSRSLPTLGSMMREAGYYVGYAGKWHLSKLPLVGDAGARRMRAIVRSYGFGESETQGELDGANAGFEHDDATTDAALRFIATHRGAEAPWFLAVNLVNPHDVMYYTSGEAMTRSRASAFPSPSVRPPRTRLYQEDLGYEVLGSSGPEGLRDRPPAVREYGAVWDALFGQLELDRGDVAREFQNFYWNCLRDSDRCLGRLLAGLASLGAADRTIVVFTSDHGEYLGAHGLRGKGVSAYREGSRVPLVVCHPDGPSGVYADNLASHIDIAPTLLGFAGASPSDAAERFPQLVGHDLGEVVAGTRGTTTARDREGILTYWTGLAYIDREAPRLVAEAMERRGPARGLALLAMLRRIAWDKRGHMRGLTTGRWKFCRYFRPGAHHQPGDVSELRRRNDVELYDTRADPAERTNLADVPGLEATLAELNARTNARIRSEIGTDCGAFVPRFAR